MPDCDLMIRGGRVVTPSGVISADVAVTGGHIAAVGLDLSSMAAAEGVDAVGLHVFPGGIDSHVHFNEPGRTDWETVATGSAALASGGYTAFVDMQLNSQQRLGLGEERARVTRRQAGASTFLCGSVLSVGWRVAMAARQVDPCCRSGGHRSTGA